jgi:peptidoglycan/xylan/chitin deacetylase (PgdA/CDA1 family)
MANQNIPILMYHSIESMPKSSIMRSLHVPLRRFEFQMRMLKFLGFKGLSLKQLRPYLEGRKKGKVVGITFDDGYQNNLINASPVLIKFGFSATCFIVSDNIGSFNKWDIVKGLAPMPLMSDIEIKKWLEIGMDIGAHTKTHADLTSLSKKDLNREIKNCKEELEKKFNIEISDFCYPYGHFNEMIYNLVKKAGYLSSVSMIRGRAVNSSDKFKLPRIPINHHTLPHLFLAKILTKYEDKR